MFRMCLFYLLLSKELFPLVSELQNVSGEKQYHPCHGEATEWHGCKCQSYFDGTSNLIP